MLPRFQDLTDAEVLAHRFQLSDAQEMVARLRGFESWEALRKGIEIMPGTTAATAPKPVPLQAEPQLFVRDIAASCAFYVDRLGFAVAFTYGEPPFYAQVARDGARLNLRHVDAPVIDPVLRDRETLLSAAITLEDAKPLFLEYQVAGLSFHQTLRTEPWGARTFIIADPDGNLILFAGKGG